MKVFKTITLTILFSVSLFAAQGFAQGVTTTATGTVLAPLEVSATGLNFGEEIFPGINEVVERTETGAAQFDITGEGGKEINAIFSLPTELTLDTNTMPITFSTTDAGHATLSTDQETATGFDPNDALGLTTTLEATSGELFIWLGGTVEPSEAQVAGEYTAQITLDFAYTGN